MTSAHDHTSQCLRALPSESKYPHPFIRPLYKTLLLSSHHLNLFVNKMYLCALVFGLENKVSYDLPL